MVSSIPSTLLLATATVLLFAAARAEEPETVISLSETTRQVTDRCAVDCRFRWCRTDENFTLSPTDRRLLMRDPNSVVNPFICLPDGTAGQILRTAEARIPTSDFFTMRISRWSPPGLVTPFPRNFFRTGIIPAFGKSGLRRRDATPDQFQVLDEQCVILPIRAFELVDPVTGASRGRRNVRGLEDCVGFVAISPKMQIELYWESSDNFDLEVIEPNGDVLDRRNPRTEFGIFNNDNGVGVCEPPRVHHENAIYRMPADGLETGVYRINVRQRTNCSFGRVRYVIRVMVDGVKVLERRRQADANRPLILASVAFRLRA